MVAPPKNAILPPGSLILITAVNGFMGCKVADELLALGYRVRGTVRDLSKSGWVKELFDSRYGAGMFELLEIADYKTPGALDAAVKGCGAFAHFVANVSFNPDPNIVVHDTVAYLTNALDAAAKEPGLKRFVYTSTAGTFSQGRFNEPIEVTQKTWNTGAVERAWAPPPYTPDRGLDTYIASKVAAEEALWSYMASQKPHFTANTTLPDFPTGVSVSPEKQSFCGMGPCYLFISALWRGDAFFKMLYPQFMIDARDNALLHVGALLHPDYRGERIFAVAHRKNWTDWIARLRAMYPEHEFPDPPENEGWDLSNIVDQPRAEDLLRWLGRPGWRPMEESMREAFDTVASLDVK